MESFEDENIYSDSDSEILINDKDIIMKGGVQNYLQPLQPLHPLWFKKLKPCFHHLSNEFSYRYGWR